ncbi:putative methyltransferase-domain-containing protein [Entophlyctis helioformis]|nr:putative methyltransferase-domain-containing protein [Entophlyctis helioformis]KAI8928225.1 putative methyltransferase-domain-containing protein [Entophlyctis helioformis]
MLLLMGPAWAALDFVRPASDAGIWTSNRFAIAGVPLFTSSDKTASTAVPGMDAGLDHTARTAETVWDGSLILAKYLETGRFGVRGKRVIELGAGRGLVGMAAALLGAKVTLTDIGDAVAPLQAIVRLNELDAARRTDDDEAGRVEGVVALDWTDRKAGLQSLGEPYDVVVAADVVWVHDLIVPLVDTLSDLIQGATVGLLAYQSRSSRADGTLFGALASVGLAVALVPDEQLDPVFRKDAVKVYCLSRQQTA